LVCFRYDVFTARADQKFFKIANLPECNQVWCCPPCDCMLPVACRMRCQDNKEDVTVTLPSWLPAGDVVLRWDWYVSTAAWPHWAVTSASHGRTRRYLGWPAARAVGWVL
jgi:hypothetical protein